jgi:hypothetical protein
MDIFLSFLGFLKGSVGILLFVISSLCLSLSLGGWLYLKKEKEKLDKQLERINDIDSSSNPIGWFTRTGIAISGETSSIDAEEMENFTIMVYLLIGVGVFTLFLAVLLLLVL